MASMASPMVHSFVDKTEDIINNAQTVEELSKFIDQISISDIKQFVLDQTTKSMDECRVRRIYYDTASIEDILSSDEIQSILIYVYDQWSIKHVSTLFKKLKKKNDILMADHREKRWVAAWYKAYTSAKDKATIFLAQHNSDYLTIKSPKSAFELFDEYECNDFSGVKFKWAQRQLIRKKRRIKIKWDKMTEEERSIWMGLELKERTEWEKVKKLFDEKRDYSGVPCRWLEKVY